MPVIKETAEETVEAHGETKEGAGRANYEIERRVSGSSGEPTSPQLRS